MQNTLVYTANCDGLTSTILTVESRQTKGFAGIALIGNTSEVCRDGKERAKTALEGLQIQLPANRILVSLAPADIRKDGNHFDLPIAISLALLTIKPHAEFDLTSWVFAAELSLSGHLRPCRGIVSIALAAAAEGISGIIVSDANLQDVLALTRLGGEAFSNFKVFGFHRLREVLDWITDGSIPVSANIELISRNHSERPIPPNFDDMILTFDQKRIIQAISIGSHSVMFSGSPGCGKSMLAERIPSVLPITTRQDHLEALQIQSLTYASLPQSLLQGRPSFRHPHHQASASAILGTPDTPGELSLAHGGILFLDEFPEFRRDIIESLREPLETGQVQVSRAKHKITWSSRILFMSARNNCPCGWYGSKKRLCSCSTQKRTKYLNRMSGPILDRIDIHYNFPEIMKDHGAVFEALSVSNRNQTESLRLSVQAARERSKFRNTKFNCIVNRDLPAKNIIEASGLKDDDFSKLLKKFTKPFHSARSIVKSLRVAITLKDLDNDEYLTERHFTEAWGWQYDFAEKERGETSLDISQTREQRRSTDDSPTSDYR